MKSIIFWDGTSTDGASIMIVPKNLQEDFSEIYDEDCFDSDPEQVYFLTNSALSDDDIDLVKAVLSKKYNCGHLANSKILDILSNYSSFFLYPGCTSGFINFKAEGFIGSFVYRSFKSLFNKLDDLASVIHLGFPHLYGSSWLDSPLSIIVKNKSLIAKEPYGISIIEKIFYEKINQAKPVFESYVDLKISDKLCFISSYFFVKAELLISLRDPTQAVILIHRAVETLFISWLVDEGTLTINGSGKVNCEKYKYLKDYLELVKPARSLTDQEVENVSRLNELRNESKFAHGYAYFESDEIKVVLDNVRRLFLQDQKACLYVSAFKEITSFTENILDKIYLSLLDRQYLVKLQ